MRSMPSRTAAVSFLYFTAQMRKTIIVQHDTQRIRGRYQRVDSEIEFVPSMSSGSVICSWATMVTRPNPSKGCVDLVPRAAQNDTLALACVVRLQDVVFLENACRC